MDKQHLHFLIVIITVKILFNATNASLADSSLDLRSIVEVKTSETNKRLKRDLQIKVVNNTGIHLPYSGSVILLPTNLSATANVDSDDRINEIRFDIVKPSSFGSIQKLRGNGNWANVTFFTMKQINKKRVRYIHLKGKPLHDVIELQMSLNDSRASQITPFKISFSMLQLKSFSSRKLLIDQEFKKISITSNELRYDTEPISTPPNFIVYTILSTPLLGTLNLASELPNRQVFLKVGSLVTQKMINDGRLFYINNSTHLKSLDDSFDFEVTTQSGKTNVEVSSFNIKYEKRLLDSARVINEKLAVLEGDRTTITNKVLDIEIVDKFVDVKYNITRQPQFGLLKLLNYQLNDVVEVAPDQVTQVDIDQNRLIYIHDDSENSADTFEFVAFDQDDNFICKGIFQFTIIMKNDNPPIRVVDKVFHVVINGEKKLTDKDLKYKDVDIDSPASSIKYSVKSIPNGKFCYVDQLSKDIESFTQEDLDKDRVLFKHSGEEKGRVTFWVTDGQFYKSGTLDIQASKPFIKLQENRALVVRMGESVVLAANNLSIESNLNIKSNSDVTFKITSPPKFGSILNNDKEISRFTLQDLYDQNIEYESKMLKNIEDVVNDFIKLRIFLNGEEFLSKITLEDQQFNISIYPQSYFQLIITKLNNITADEDNFATITSDNLQATYSMAEPENILYLITELPKYGILSLKLNSSTNTKDQTKNESVLLFTQKDIDDELIQYKYTDEIEINLTNEALLDKFTFDVTNRVATLRDKTIYFSIISKIIALSTENITVTEGQSIGLISNDFIVSNEYYANQIDEYIIIEDPKFGFITLTLPDETKTFVKSFTSDQLKRGFVAYEHDGSETTRDWLTVVASISKSDKESMPSTIHVIVEPVNDETPHVVNNSGLELWEGTSKIITKSNLAAVDDDSVTGSIVYQIFTPSNGYVALVNNRQVHINTFTQDQINSGQIVFVHSGELSGGFRFQVNDGINFDSPHVFAVTAKPVSIRVLVNQHLRVFPGMQQSLTRDHLVAMTNDGKEDREFIYQVIREPKYGRFLIEMSDGSTKTTLLFSQKQIDQNLVLYEQNKPIDGLVVIDEITFDIESQFVQTLRGLKFNVEIAARNFGKEVASEISELIILRPVQVKEGKFATIDGNNIDISKIVERWKTKQYKGLISKLAFKTQRKPNNGLVLYEGHDISQNLVSVPISALNQQKLVYKHDDSNTLNDTIHFGIFLSNGIDILLTNQSLQVIVDPINDEPPVLITKNPTIEVIEGSKSLITTAFLNAKDNDGLPEDIIYEVIFDPNQILNGYFLVENQEFVNQFNQQQINSNLVYFKHNGSLVKQKIKMRIKDGTLPCSSQFHQVHCGEEFTFTITVKQLTLKMLNHSTIYLAQGSKSALILPKNLGAVSNDNNPSDILYLIKRKPSFGIITVKNQTTDKFFQNDINELVVSYNQINKESKDSMTVDVISGKAEREKLIQNIEVSIVVKPMIKAKEPFLVCTPGSQCTITLDYLDASELASHTKSTPNFIVISFTKYGTIKKLTSKNAKSWTKRKRSSKSLSEFTHEDIVENKIVYVANENLDLTYPNEILVDLMQYQVEAYNVQPALGVLVVNIVNHKLIVSHGYEPKNNATTPGILQTQDLNYLIITRDHLLVVFGFFILLFLTIIVIILLKFRHSTRRPDTPKTLPPMTGHLAIPPVMESPRGSDFGGEVLQMQTSRFSPRSTPSVSEVETGIVLMAPPTSPSLSTNCSILDVRSRSETPRSCPRPAAINDRFRNVCPGGAGDIQETNFPLPPPLLYYGTENGASNTSWNNSVSMCEVFPCQNNHCHSTCQISTSPKHMLSDDVQAQYPMGRTNQWDSENMQSSFAGICSNQTAYHHCNNCPLTSNCKFSHSELSYSTENKAMCNQMSTAPIKSQYWV